MNGALRLVMSLLLCNLIMVFFYMNSNMIFITVMLYDILSSEFNNMKLTTFRFLILLRHYATSWKVMGSNPNEVIGFFNECNPSSLTMTLGFTQPLTDMSTRYLPGE
jgi:hypothetical protein